MWKILFSAIFLIDCIHDSKGFMSYISCEFYNYSTCNVYNITPITVEHQIVQLLGESENFKNHSITFLNLDSPNIANFIPSDIFYMFPNLQEFNMRNVSLTYLTAEAFSNCNNLSSIAITHNNFTKISSKFAKRCHNLNKIYLNYNGITAIDEDALNGLGNLNILDLSFNEITCIPPKLFESTAKIESISFKNNAITAIDRNSFGSLQTIKIINLEGNKITFIPIMNFHEAAMSNALNLIMNDNPIYAIEPKFIEKFFAIENSFSSINFTMSNAEGICIPNGIEHSIIQRINYKLFNDALTDCYANWTEDLMKVKTLCDSSVPIKSIDSKQLSIKNTCAVDAVCRYYLDHLNQYTCVMDGIDFTATSITGNHISQLLDDIDVVNVFIANSLLNTIPSFIFDKFPNLKFLSINNSTMTFIHERTLTKCENLKYLDVSHNNIMHISKYAFKMCTNLQIIDLSENPIEYLDIQYVRRLRRIYLNKKSLFE